MARGHGQRAPCMPRSDSTRSRASLLLTRRLKRKAGSCAAPKLPGMYLRESTEALPELHKERPGLCSLHPGFISPKAARCGSAQAKQRIQRKQARLSITAAYHRRQPGICFHSEVLDRRNPAAAYQRLRCFLWVSEAAVIPRCWPGAAPRPAVALRKLARKEKTPRMVQKRALQSVHAAEVFSLACKLQLIDYW